MKPISKEAAPAAKTSSRRSPAARSPRSASVAPHFEVSLDMDTDANFYTGLDREIAGGGLFIATYDIRAPGTSVTVDVALPSGKILRRQAKVAWIRHHDESAIELHPGMGVAFDDLDAEETREIEAFMARRDSLFYA